MVNQFRAEPHEWRGILLALVVYLTLMLLLVAAVEGWLVR